MNSIQCFDGMGGPVIFQWHSVANHFHEYLDRVKLHNSYTGRAAKAVIEAINLAEKIKGADLTELPDTYKNALVNIRLGLEPIALATKDYQAAQVTLDHLQAMRDHVDACLDLLGSCGASLVAEARAQVVRPDALDGLVAKTVTCSSATLKSYNGGNECDGLLVAILKSVNREHHGDLSSITKPHRLKTFVINTEKQKILISKPLLYIVWGTPGETTLCLGKPSAVRQSSGKSTNLMRVKAGRWWGDQTNENFREAMKLAMENLNRVDAIDTLLRDHG